MNMHKATVRTEARELRYNVAQLLQAATGAQRRHSFEIENPYLGGELEFSAPLEGTAILTRTAGGILAEINLGTAVRLACDRCLEPLDCPLEIEWSEEFHPAVDAQTGRHLPLDLDELDEAVVIDEQHIMDLTETVRQHLLLAVPSHPVCQEDCAGLCPQCGANLNRETCDCSAKSLDPRWAGLAELLEDAETEEAA